MKIVIFGLAVSSSWGNGHATLWRGLIRALAKAGHRVVFFERDAPYYAQHRDLTELPGGDLILYANWEQVRGLASRQIADADIAMVTSYCPDGIEATAAVCESNSRLRVFYDLDTPVTLARLEAGEEVLYIGARGLRDFDLVLSYTGGAALDGLRRLLQARRAEPLYGSVDPEVHYPVAAEDRFRADMSYLGTYAPDREQTLSELFAEAARLRPRKQFILAGAMYDDRFPWQPNIRYLAHVPPAEHPAFYCSSRLTLNVTRGAMARMGYCPSGRLFEAAACGAVLVSDWWPGLETFFTPGSEILIASSTGDVLDALDLPGSEVARLARAARERALAEHTAEVRAREMVALFDGASSAAGEAA